MFFTTGASILKYYKISGSSYLMIESLNALVLLKYMSSMGVYLYFNL